MPSHSPRAAAARPRPRALSGRRGDDRRRLADRDAALRVLLLDRREDGVRLLLDREAVREPARGEAWAMPAGYPLTPPVPGVSAAPVGACRAG